MFVDVQYSSYTKSDKPEGNALIRKSDKQIKTLIENESFDHTITQSRWILHARSSYANVSVGVRCHTVKVTPQKAILKNVFQNYLSHTVKVSHSQGNTSNIFGSSTSPLATDFHSEGNTSKVGSSPTSTRSTSPLAYVNVPRVVSVPYGENSPHTLLRHVPS